MYKKYAIILLVLIIAIMGLFSIFGGGGQPVYDPIEAGKVTYDSLSEDFKTILTKEDVNLILDLEFQYQQNVGLTSESEKSNQDEPFVMDNKLNQFIIAEAEKKNKTYSTETIDAVINAEDVYLKKIGVIKE